MSAQAAETSVIEAENEQALRDAKQAPPDKVQRGHLQALSLGIRS